MENTINRILSACSLDGQPEHAPAQFRRRIEKAGDLIKTGKVFRGCVVSQDNQSRYRVRCAGIPKVWSCTCPDFGGRGGYDTDLVCGGYGHQCKHTLAQLICELEGQPLTPYAPTYHADPGDFWQGMSARDADQLCDPAYQKALLAGGDAVLMYFVNEILNKHTAAIRRHASDTLKIGDCNGRELQVLQDELRSASPSDIFRCFEIPEVNGEDYSDFWPQLYEAANNGQLAALKSKLIDELNN